MLLSALLLSESIATFSIPDNSDGTRSVARQDQQRAIDQVTAEIMVQMATDPPRVVEVPSKEDMIAMGDALMAEMNYTPEEEEAILARINNRF